MILTPFHAFVRYLFRRTTYTERVTPQSRNRGRGPPPALLHFVTSRIVASLQPMAGRQVVRAGFRCSHADTPLASARRIARLIVLTPLFASRSMASENVVCAKQ